MATAPKISDQEPQRVSLDRYLHCSDWEPDAEYVDGEIEERPMGENDHSAWQQAILTWFQLHAKEWNLRIRPEQRVQVSASRFRVPDVAILDRDLPIEQIVTRPPIAVFEVLSPEDRQARMLRKLNDYAALGIPQIWVIDPEGPRIQRFLHGVLVPAGVFEEAARNIRFEMTEIQALVD
jgi:Uma2 family endonuclease